MSELTRRQLSFNFFRRFLSLILSFQTVRYTPAFGLTFPPRMGDLVCRGDFAFFWVA